MKTEEILIEDLNCWFIEHSNIVNATYSKLTILDVKEMKYVDYLKICDEYPMIYLGDKLITKYNTEFEGYVFMPTVEFATEEKCYIRHCDDDDILSVIINSFSVNDLKPKEIVENKKTESKTYLMIDGNRFIKIGKSYSPRARECTLQSQNPTIELIAFCEQDVEKELHIKYASKRKRGEWFNLSKKEISEIIQEFNFKKTN
jgi:hypothetical protein